MTDKERAELEEAIAKSEAWQTKSREAMLSLDREQILQVGLETYGKAGWLKASKYPDGVVAMAHEQIYLRLDMPADRKEQSRQWLAENWKESKPPAEFFG